MIILGKINNLYKNNKKLLRFMALSYLDRAVVFLLPLLVFQMFRDQLVYVSIEYIYSVSTVVIPLIDLGLAGYFFYAYRNTKDKNELIKLFLNSFKILYLLISFIGVCLIVFHYLGHDFEDYIVFIISRLLFVVSTVFYASYYRLIEKPEKAIYITLTSNCVSLLFVIGYFYSDSKFYLWLIFIGQIIFVFLYLIKCLKDLFFVREKNIEIVKFKNLIGKAILFSWPTIFQVFIMMYIANYGKLNSLKGMNLSDGTLLSIIQRFCMLIHLTHTAIFAFVLKEIYMSGKLLEIKKSILKKYILLILFSAVCVFFLNIGYFTFLDIEYSFNKFLFVLTLMILYVLIWCLGSYFEVYYSRENQNKIKLFLAIINGVLFMAVLNISKLDYLERIVFAMLVSTLITFIVSLLVLKRRKYYLS